MKIKKYTILKNNLVFKGIKYEVGKRYKKNSLLVYEDIEILSTSIPNKIIVLTINSFDC